jgi:hypothetical protein
MDAGFGLLPAHATVNASLTLWAAWPGLMNQVNGNSRRWRPINS